jgi:lipopolysaccharide export system permease protein
VICFITLPQTNQLFNAFRDSKKAEMTFNVVPEEFGQKFGHYYIYITDEVNGKFKETVIYYQDDNHSDQIISADSGEMLNQNSIFSLVLYDGKGYTFKPDMARQMIFKKLQTYDSMNNRGMQLYGVGDYWKQSLTDKQRKQKMLFYFFISAIPLLSLYMIVAFSIINPRYQRGHSFIVIGSIAALFYFLASLLDKYGTEWMLAALVTSSFLLGVWLFYRLVNRYF